MIIKASQRTGARNLASHLMNTKDNEHVTVHELRGVVGQSLHAAFLEIDASTHATRCEKPFFSVSFNPPADAVVSNDDFDKAFEQLENKLGLNGQPRVVVYHEKEARKHAHVVWSRIDVDKQKAVHLSHFKQKCTDISRQLYLEHGWKVPDGLTRKQDRDPFNLSVSEWQCLKRQSIDPKEIKSAIQEAFKYSDGLKGFRYALEEKGLFLAKGDKRGFVAVDHKNNVFSLSRCGGLKPRDLKQSLGSADGLPSVSDTHKKIRKIYNEKALKKVKALKQKHAEALSSINEQKSRLVEVQRAERREIKERQLLELQAKIQSGKARYSKGLKRLFDLVSGRRKRVQLINQTKINILVKRHAKYNLQLQQKHLSQSKELHKQKSQLKNIHLSEREQLAKAIQQVHRTRHINQIRLPQKAFSNKELKQIFERHTVIREDDKKLTQRQVKRNRSPKLER